MISTNIESVNGLDSAVVESQPLELLDIPGLAIKNILRHLDLHTLKKLRLVSKSTKQWVEQTEFLQKFKIHIFSDKVQEEISNSTEVPWNNFVITWEWFGQFNVLNSEFAEKFGPFIKHLVINNDIWIYPYHNIFCSLTVNPAIETLYIKTLRFDVESDWRCKPPVWMRNLKKLKKFKIEKCPFSDDPNEDVITEAKIMFDMILQGSPNLTHLHIPTLRLIDKDADVKSKDLHYQIVLSPLLNYLNRIHNSGKRVNLTIDLDGIDNKYHRQIFPISPQGLLELSKLCKKTETKLCNVTSQAFKNRRYVSQVDRNILEEVISSIKMLNDPSGLRGIYLPPSPKVIVEIHVDDKADYSSFVLREPIHSIHFSSDYFPIQENLYSNLFQVVRPSVQELKCDWDMGRDFGEGNLQTIWTGIDISTSFPNLKHLHLKKWGYGEGADFNVLLTRLLHLERLCLNNCYLDGLMGPDNMFIDQLQNLIHLEFIDTHVTDLHIRDAFRHMRLKTFVLKCDMPLLMKENHCSKVTFKTGISTLCSIDGGFGDTIEHFDISIPNDCTKDVLDVFVNQFKNLKSYKTCKHCPQREISEPVPDIS